MRKRIVITGIGVRSSNAKNTEDLLVALKELREGQCNITLYDTQKLRSNIGCQIKEKLKYQTECDERTTAIAFEAIDDLYQDPEIEKLIRDNKYDVVFSFATSMSGNQNMMTYVDSKNPQEDENYVYIVPDFINKIGQKLGEKGPDRKSVV